MRTTGTTSGEQAIVRIIEEIQPATRAFHQFVIGIEEKLFEQIGALSLTDHNIDLIDVGIMEEQRFPTLIAPAR